jgi:hypothetical protein
VAGNIINVSIIAEQHAASGITQLIGGDAIDQFFFLVTTTTAFTIPNLALSGWSAQDAVIAQVANSVTGDVTLNARDNYGSRQVLQGGVGNDTMAEAGLTSCLARLATTGW